MPTALANRVTWIRQAPAGTFTEQILADVAGPAHVQPVDLDRDGDLDVAVASMGVLFPNNAKIGAVIVLENDGRQNFTRRVLIDQVARVSDVRAGDLDGDGDLDLSVAQFGYDQGETRWMENVGGWRFESHVLQTLSGAINAEIADVDGDGDLDIVSLVSQEWEEIYVFVNDGRGEFTPTRVFGASNEDFGSSWISLADLDRDGDVDVLYSNGDAFDYAPPTGRGWNGVQWLENRGGVRFVYHRIGDFSGASSPQAADLDGDGDIDIAVVSAYNNWEKADAQSLAWFENDGAMGFTLHPLATSPTHLITLAIGSLDGDPRPDLITGGMHMSSSVRPHVPRHGVDQSLGRRAMSRKRRASSVAPAASQLEAPPPRAEARSRGPWLAVAIAVAVVGLAWWGAGALTRRAQGAMLPPIADLSDLPAAAREQVQEADAAARDNPRAGEAVGALGMAYHASLMPGAAVANVRTGGATGPGRVGVDLLQRADPGGTGAAARGT